MTKINSDNQTPLDSGESEEEKAYQEIKEAFGIDPVRIVAHQLDIKFLDMQLDEELGTATMFYICEKKTLSYIITCSYDDETWSSDIEDILTNEYSYTVDYTDVQVREYNVAETGESKYTARFTYQDMYYQLTGIVKKEDLEEILDNLHFL